MTTTRGRKRAYKEYARLDRELILDAALTIAARPGTVSVRVRDLGEELGADPSAVYRHFRNKDELTAALVDRLMHLVQTRITAPQSDWRGYLRDGAAQFLEVFLEYPCIGAEAARQRGVGPAELRFVDSVLGALAMAGLTGDELVSSYGALTGFAMSFASIACVEQIALGQTPADEQWVQPSAPFSSTEFPHLAAVWEDVAALSYRTTFAAGIEALLDAIADRVAAAGGRTGAGG